MDLIYFIDMIRCFTEPYHTDDGKVVKNRRMIVKKYVNTWLFPDLYAFYPLAYLRYISVWEEGTINPF